MRLGADTRMGTVVFWFYVLCVFLFVLGTVGAFVGRNFFTGFKLLGLTFVMLVLWWAGDRLARPPIDEEES